MSEGESEEERRDHMNCHRRVEKALVELNAAMKTMQTTVDRMAHTLHEDEDSLVTRMAVIENKVADLVWLRTAVFSVVLSSIGQIAFLVFQVMTKR